MFLDVNGDGWRQANEAAGLSGVWVQAQQGNMTYAIQSAGADGWYQIANLPPGAYIVTEDQPAGYVSTSSDSITVSVQAGLETVLNFGEVAWTPTPVPTPTASATPTPTMTPTPTRTGTASVTVTPTGTPTASVTPSPTATPTRTATVPGTATPSLSTVEGIVWEDQDRDGQHDPNEPGIAGVAVILKPVVTRLFETQGERRTLTDATGYFRFADVVPIAYVIRADVPALYWPTTSASLTISPALHETLEVSFGFYRAPMARYLPLMTHW